jgi:hypothetical protein
MVSIQKKENGGTNLGESSALCDSFRSFDKGAQVKSGNLGVSHKFHEIVDNNHRASLNLHTSVIESTDEEGN